jgi:hypothetical protein
VVIDGKIPSELHDHWVSKKWEFGRPISFLHENLPFIDPSTELVEFGKVRKFQENQLLIDLELCRQSSFLNSKLEQAIYSKEISFADERIGIVRSPEDVIEWADGRQVILKEPLSNSGKGHTIWSSPNHNYRLNRLIFPMVVEEFYPTRNLDFGILLEIASDRIELLAISKMIIGKDFNYRGSFFYPRSQPNWILEITKALNEDYDFVNSWESFIRSEDYQGPLSIDGFFLEDGSLRIRSECNFRYTMGRIGYEVMKERTHSDDWKSSPPNQVGIIVLHKKQNLYPKPDYELILSMNESDLWKIVYVEYKDSECLSF